MSQLAQAVERAVQEMRKESATKKHIAGRRQPQEQKEQIFMVKTRKTKRSAQTSQRKRRRASKRPVKTAEGLKTYRLLDGIPDSIGKETTARAILQSIQKRKGATSKMIRADIGAKVPDPTLRFYLGKFQRDKVVVTAHA